MKTYLSFLLVAIIALSCRTSAKLAPSEVASKLGPNSYFIVDGKEADQSVIQSMDANQVAALTTYFGKDAVKRYGPKAKDGSVEVETRTFSIHNYQAVLKDVSAEYRLALEMEGTDSSFQYILNGKLLADDDESILASITPDLLKSIKVMEQAELVSQYGIILLIRPVWPSQLAYRNISKKVIIKGYIQALPNLPQYFPFDTSRFLHVLVINAVMKMLVQESSI